MNILRYSGLAFADAGLGIIATAFVCALLNVEVSMWYLAVGLIFAYAPDADWFLDKHFLKTGLVAAYAAHPYDHREGLHKPLLWALAISGWGVIAPGPAPIIALVAVMCHFLHDTVGTGWGIPWLWPLTKRRFKFFAKKDPGAPQASFLVSWSHDELQQSITNHGRANWKQYYYHSWTRVAIGETALMVVGLIVGVVELIS